MTTATPAKVARAQAEESVRKELVSAAHSADVEQKTIALACGRPPQHVQQWFDRDGQKVPSVADLHLMPSAVALPLIRQAAHMHGYDVAPASEGNVDVTNIESLHRILRECAEVQLAHVSALADGTVSAAELATIEREAQEAAEVLTQLSQSARKRRISAVR